MPRNQVSITGSGKSERSGRERVLSSYADFRPMWEVWKRNTRRPSDECEART